MLLMLREAWSDFKSREKKGFSWENAANSCPFPRKSSQEFPRDWACRDWELGMGNFLGKTLLGCSKGAQGGVGERWEWEFPWKNPFGILWKVSGIAGNGNSPGKIPLGCSKEAQGGVWDSREWEFPRKNAKIHKFRPPKKPLLLFPALPRAGILGFFPFFFLSPAGG